MGRKIKRRAGLLQVLFVLAVICQANATIVDVCDGTFTISDGDDYDTVNVFNDASITMTGGDAFYCNMFNSTTWDCYGGVMGVLDMNDTSVARLYADRTPTMYLYNDSQIHIYNGELGPSAFIYDNAEFHVYGTSLEYITGEVEGYWPGGLFFRIHIRNYSEIVPEEHIFLHEIPEPATFLLFATSIPVLRAFSA